VSSSDDTIERRVAQLERELAELRSRRSSRRSGRVARLPAAIGLVLVMGMLPALVLAGHQFGDVPAINPFHADISALADAGVTTGCGGDNFCPDGLVTREQMAAFMNRLGALGAGKTPVVNADKLDGKHASAFYTKAQVNALLSDYVPRSELGSLKGLLRWARIRDLGSTVEVYLDNTSYITPEMWVTRTATGVYEVAFPGVQADGGYHAIFVSPEQGQTTVFRACKVFQTSSLGDPTDTMVAKVRCYDQNAALANTDFHILVLQ